MNKSEKLKSERKIKFKCFLLANILTLFFAVVFFSPASGHISLAAGLSAEEAGNSFDFNQGSAYSEPFSKLIEFLNAQKNELAKYDGDFLNAKTFSSGTDSVNEINPAVSSFTSSVFESIKSFVVDSPKQYLGTVFESIKNFVFHGPSQNNFEYKSPNNKENAKEIEKLKQQYEVAIDETNVISQKFSLLQNELEKIKNSGVVVRQPIIEQKVVERTIERIVDSLPRSAGAGVSGLSQSDLDSKISEVRTELSNLNTNLTNQINNLSASTNRQTAATYQTISLTNKIDSLSGTRLTNITVNGVSGLTDSDIPDDIIASNYLPLTGGTLSGNLGIGTTSPYAKLSVVGSVVAEYFYATSTTATSTFGGRLLATKAPTLPHTFSIWDTDTANSNVMDSSFLINPSSAVADSNLFGIAVGGNVKFLVDAEGDVFVRNLTATGTVNQANTNISTLTVENATILGDADTDALTIRSGVWSLTSTATSTVAMTNGLNFDSNTFVIDPNSNRIGIGTSSPYAKLSVVGAGVFDDNVRSSYFTATSTTATSTFPYLSVTTNSNLGTVVGGIWQGTAIGSQYGGTGLDSSVLTGLAQIVSGTWSASSTLSVAYGGTGWGNLQSNSILLGNGAGRIATTSAGTDGYVLALSAGVPTWLATSTLAEITGTLSVVKGGTGQTSFGQGWLNSDGTTISASTSPTVNYITATSTTATSTFAGNLSVSGTASTTNLIVSNLGLTGNTLSAQNTNGNINIGSNGTGYVNLAGPVKLTVTSAVATAGPHFRAGSNGLFTFTAGSAGYTFNNNADSASLFFIDNAGNIGIGNSSPTYKLDVAGLGHFTGLVDAPNFTATSTTATSTFPYLSITTNSNLGTVVGGTWNGTAISNQYGGTGLDSSALTGLAQIVSGTWSASSTLSVAYGGTGWNSIAAGYIPFGNGAAALATSTSFYWDNGNSRLGIGTSTPDSKLTVFASADDSAIEFSSASGSTYKWTMGMDYSDAGKFKIASSTALGSIDRFTIDGNGYVGIGTSTPARRLDVADSGTNIPQLRLSRESNVYTDFSVAQTTGDLSLALYGTNADDISLLMPDGSTGANLWVCEGAACPNGISFTGGGNLFVEGVIKYATSTTPKTRRSIILTAAGAIVPASGGAAKTQIDGSNSHSYYVLDFDASSDEAAYWQWTMPDSYDNGVIDVTYYWEAGATSGNTVWCFQSTGLTANESEDIEPNLSSWPSECETDGAQINPNDLASITETATSSRITAGEYSVFKVFRDADNGSDTMTGDARLVKVKIEYGVATESD